MNVVAVVIAVIIVALIVVAAQSIRVVTQYEKGVLFRLGRVKDVREPGLTFIVPVVDVLHAHQPADRHHAYSVAGHHHA